MFLILYNYMSFLNHIIYVYFVEMLNTTKYLILDRVVNLAPKSQLYKKIDLYINSIV